MTQVQLMTVLPKDDNVRLDRWFGRYYPALKNGPLQKMLRGKNIRVNGVKALANQRLKAGDLVRIPPMPSSVPDSKTAVISKTDAAFIQSLVIYKDKDVIILNKPAGLAVQGGSKTTRHIDGMLEALRFEADEKPRLVHRLDKDTSGVLVLARSAKAATALTRAFAARKAHKVYWAVVRGRPTLEVGKIEAPLAKLPGAHGTEMVRVDYDCGASATTFYRTIEALGKQAAWIALYPKTGRTHQLRVHCRLMNTPILGDVKYGFENADAALFGGQASLKMHLHARGIRLAHPDKSKGILEIYAPLPEHMKKTFEFCGFNEKEDAHPFDYLEQE